MKPALKHFAERALIASGVERVLRRSRSERTLVLAYHNVRPEGEPPSGNSNLHLPQREFARQLDVLQQSHEIVPIESLLSDSSTPRPRVVITFDDAYAGSLTAGVDELVRRGMPATIFVAPALIDSVPWWETLADPANGAVPDDLRRNALDVLGGQQEAVLGWAHSKALQSRPASTLPRIGTESQLAAAASKPGITLGSHSWSHANLCGLTEPELEAELTRPRRWLESRFDSVVPWLTYPYGLFNETVQRAAAKAGYLGAFRIDGGWLPASDSLPLYALPRHNIPFGLSINGFRLRLVGL